MCLGLLKKLRNSIFKPPFLGVIFLFQTFIQIHCYGQYLPTDWQSNLAAGQGNSYTAWANDGSSIFYNPAGLSILHNRRSKKILNAARAPFPDEIQANDQMLSQMEANPEQWFKNLLNSAKENRGKPSYLSLQAFPFVVLSGKNSPTFLFGIPFITENSAYFNDTSNLNYAFVKSISTLSGAFAISDATKLGGFRWGISIRPNYRVDYESSVFDSTQDDLSTKNFANIVSEKGTKTFAVAYDAGIMLTLNDYWFPTMAVSVRNIPTGCIDNYIDPITYKPEVMCGTVRSGSALSPNESRVDPTEIRAGISLTPRGHLGRTIVNLRLSADIYPISIKDKDRYYGIPSVEPASLIHAGGELFFGSALVKNTFGLRGGYMNQEPTWGASINLMWFDLGYSSYAATSSILDLSGNTHKYTERRHMLNLSWVY